MHIKLRPVYFGQKDVPPPPEGTPEKFRQAWMSMPNCCRDFYLKPGQGCCAGLAEPQAQLMETAHVSPEGLEMQKRQKLNKPSGNIFVRLLRGILNWFREAAQILWTDIKVILSIGKL